MNWYITKIVCEISIQDHEAVQFDEQWRLIGAEDEREAMIKAKIIGEQEEEVFENQNGKTVSWRFAGIADLHALETLEHGTELITTTREIKNVAHYKAQLKARHTYLENRNLYSPLMAS